MNATQSPPTRIVLHDRYSGGPIHLVVRQGVVTGAMGCEPERYVGLREDDARHYARYGQTSTPKFAKATVTILPSRYGWDTKQGPARIVNVYESDIGVTFDGDDGNECIFHFDRVDLTQADAKQSDATDGAA